MANKKVMVALEIVLDEMVTSEKAMQNFKRNPRDFIAYLHTVKPEMTFHYKKEDRPGEKEQIFLYWG